MVGRILQAVFGCSHQYGFPITVRAGKRRNVAASLTGTYVVCLDCGRELPYDWSAMRVTPGRRHAWNGLAETVAQ